MCENLIPARGTICPVQDDASRRLWTMLRVQALDNAACDADVSHAVGDDRGLKDRRW
jgi:hypothetical protein